MATIPTYERQVEVPRTAQPDYFSPRVNSDQFGVGIGESVQRLGVAGEDAAVHIVATDSYAKVNKARMAFETDVDSWTQTQAYTKLGQDAEGLPAAAQEYIAQTKAKYAEGLKGVQLTMFDNATGDYIRGTQNAVARHTRDQHFNFVDQTSEQSQVQAQQMAAGNFTDPTLLNVARKNNEQGIEAHIQLYGLRDADGKLNAVGEEYAAKSRSAFNLGVVQSFINSDNPQGAQDYFDEHKDEINPLYHGQLLHVMKEGVRQQMVLDKSEELAQKYAPDWPKAMEALQQEKGLDARSRNEVLQNLNQREEAQRKARQDAEYAARQKALEWVSQDPVNNSFLNVTAAQASAWGMSYDDQLTLDRAREAEARRKTKDPEAIVAESNALNDRIALWDPSKDKDHSEEKAIHDDWVRLQMQDATVAADSLKRFMDKQNPDKGLPQDVKSLLYWRGNNNTPGGVQGYLLDAAKKANDAHWYRAGPLGGEKVLVGTANAKVGYPKEVYNYAASLFDRVKQAAIAHGKEWDAQDVDEYMRNDPEIQGLLDKGAMLQWKNKLGGPVVPTTFTPTDVLAK